MAKQNLLTTYNLKDKYLLNDGRVYVTGTQAIIRLLIAQKKRDSQNNLKTAGFISGYRGSPMTAVDNELWRAGEDLLSANDIKFWPGLNENLAMTAVWGTQQVGFHPDTDFDGVFAMWYGKGPGLDQTIDGLRQANLHGTTKHGGVLVLAGDDPEMTSTVDPYHSELLFEDLLMPVLYPADIQEVYDLGLIGIAMSRFCGAFIGFKLLPETIETAASIDGDINRLDIQTPEFDFPEDGVNARHNDSFTFHELRSRKYKLPAALAFGRANNVNKVTCAAPKKKIGIVSMGKTWLHVNQALQDLGIDQTKAKSLGISILKISMPFPVDEDLYRDFAEGNDEVLIFEEKREQIQNGFVRACYNMPADKRPRIVGRYDEAGEEILPPYMAMTSEKISHIIAERLKNADIDTSKNSYLTELNEISNIIGKNNALNTARVPYFCSGCPHNSSTKVPEGSRAMGGVGCHFMANWMNRNVELYTHMGGEGATWIGTAPYVKTPHIFQQIGDGTYYHSGSLAIRAAVSANINITYKILFNDAVAMTGGQPVDGPLSVPMITHQMHQEGVKKIVIVTDEPEKYDDKTVLAPDTNVHHRRELNRVQSELREIEGTTILIYDQTCAAEKRRRRKRGKFPDPAKRAFINNRVCEGCGDCSKTSNCLSIQPLDTPFGRKRQVHQSSCNKDYSCVEGFCPSFVTVEGGDVKKGEVSGQPIPDVPSPEMFNITAGETYNMLVAGIGGTGVVTIGALLGTAAHLEGKGVSIVDQLGFAQKGGPVVTHIKIAQQPSDIHTARIGMGGADIVLACDMLTAGSDKTISVLSPKRSRVFANLEPNMSSDFIHDPEMKYPSNQLLQRFNALIGDDKIEAVEATKLAIALLGDALGANLFMVGYAWQKGAIPLSDTSILRAVEINGVQVDWNKKAFMWGRAVAHDPSLIGKFTEETSIQDDMNDTELEEYYYQELTDYQNKDYADKFRTLVKKAINAEKKVSEDAHGFARAVIINLYKLMAYKDEYEVARLYTQPEFKQKLVDVFEGDYKLKFHLSPPLLAAKDALTGRPKKYEFGSWVLVLFKILAKLKTLRGSVFDIFGYTQERKMERSLIQAYSNKITEICDVLDKNNITVAISIAKYPEKIKGYGPVKENNVTEALTYLEKLEQSFIGETMAKQ